MSDDAVADEAILEPIGEVANQRSPLTALIKRYWGEIAVVTLAILLWAPRLSGPIDLRWDAGVYYLLGTSLAEGHGYRIPSEPGSPQAVQYPPLLPGIVALYQLALGTTNPDVVAPWLRKSYAAIFVLYSLATLLLARRYLSVFLAVLAVALSLIQVNTLFLSDVLFTELPFVLISVLFALVAVSDSAESRFWWREIMAFFLASLGFFLRTVGAALLVAWVLEALLRRRWRLGFARGLVVLVPIVAWQGYVASVRGSYDYTHPAYEYQHAPYQFYNVSYAENVGLIDPSQPASPQAYARALTSRLTTNLRRMGKALGEGVSTSEGYWRELLSDAQARIFGRPVIPLFVVVAPILILSGLVIAGVVIFIYRCAWLMACIVLASVGLICTTPWPGQFQRYLMPLTPFLAIAALLALSEAGARLRSSKLGQTTKVAGQMGVVGFLLLPLALQIYTASEIFRLRKSEGASFVAGRGTVGPHFFYHPLLWVGWEEAIAWIHEHAAQDAIVATPACHLCYLRTGLHAVSPPVESDPARARHLLLSVPVSYVIVDRDYSLPAIEGDTSDWRLTQSFHGTRIYRRPNLTR